ncbi:sulfotransferase family protein [Pseudoduganella namucuonensis]|uniref:Sulfotransferase family protein n=1 Tax=Pseudoduganella namucuonensis TaxID=1035707 RepID=A0A1I7HEL9_9BURK|nr:sulfotransferase [Pseudoduganella namucuonensis]SFU59160.1 Sulfotransferase family protein [Pseudoduganella namucuonensis]
MDNKPSSTYHPPEVQAINAATPGVQPGDLTVEALMAAAREQTGLERFGDDCFLPGLSALLASVKTDASLNAFGRLSVQQNAIGFLKNRLWANACFEAHPEILQREISAPIIIVGPHRSGTTRLQRMMATDSRLSHLRTWEGLNPAPRIGQPDLGKSERHAEVKQALATADILYPGAFLGHPMDADWAEEEMHLLDSSWCGFSPLGLYSGIDSYYQWFLTFDKTAAYRYMADLLKLISWSRGEPEGKRWVLKNPQHMLNLDTLLAVFPDAKLVFTHRDPIKTVASTMSLMWHFAVQHTDANCRRQVRDLWLDFCEQAAGRCVAQRATMPHAQQLDVHYEAINRDWRAAMRSIYDFAGMDLSAEAEQAMADWLTHSEGHHGGHRYSLDDFGLTAQEVDARMMFAREHHGIAYESGRG